VASVSVLYISDDIVGPHLELLRNICEPASRSRPHVTVRYFERLSVPKEYLNTRVTQIDLIEPGAFGLEGASRGTSRTVFIRCKSDDLAPLEHKPHYPASEFHITIYDGKSTKFAKALLKLLRGFEWGLRVQLPPNTSLTEIPIKPRRSKRLETARTYPANLQQLFKSATSQHLSWETLVGLSDQERLKLSRSICRHLHQATASFPRTPTKQNGGAKRNKKGPGKSAQNHKRQHTGKNEGDSKKSKNSKSKAREIHLTPPELAREIAEYAVQLIEPPDSKISFGDPAVGTGAFYAALLQVLPREQISSAIGIDISAEQVAAAQWRWSHRGMKAMIGDYLHMDRLQRRNLILANPPYLRHQEIAPKYKQELRERASVKMRMRVSARSGLYVYFLLLSHEWMKPDAVAAWLIPSEFMQTAYGAVVRHYLTHKVQLVRIHQFGHDDPQFENAMVLPAVVVFRNRPPSPGQSALISVGGTLAGPKKGELIRLEELRHQAKWVVTRRSSRNEHASDIRVGNVFIVRRGIATGANEFFVMERTRAAKLGIPTQALRPLLPKARTLEGDIVEREPDGYPHVQTQLCLLDCQLSEDEIRARYPDLMNYLTSVKEAGILKRNLVRRRHPWYKQEQREPAPFLCTYMGRGRGGGPPIRFIWNKSDAVATNTYLMLYPRAGLATLLQKKPGLANEIFALLQDTARETVSEKWRVHAEGLYKIEPGELLDVRFPSNPIWLKEAIALEPAESYRSTLTGWYSPSEQAPPTDAPIAALAIGIDKLD